MNHSLFYYSFIKDISNKPPFSFFKQDTACNVYYSIKWKKPSNNVIYIHMPSTNVNDFSIIGKNFRITSVGRVIKKEFPHNLASTTGVYIAVKNESIDVKNNYKSFLTALKEVSDINIDKLTFNSLINKLFESHASEVSTAIKNIIKNHITFYSKGFIILADNFLQKEKKNLNFFYTLELTLGSSNRVRTFITQAFPTDAHRNIVVDLGLTKTSFDDSYDCNLFLVPKKGQGQQILISSYTINPIINTSDHIKFEITSSKNGILNGKYSLKANDEDPTQWFMVKMKEEKSINLNQFIHIPKKRPSTIKFYYKYTLAMQPKKAANYLKFEDSMLNKHIQSLYKGTEELFVGPVYTKGSMKYYQLVMDFDGKGSISSVRSLANKINSLSLGEFFIVQFTGNGYHLKSLFAVKDVDLKALRTTPELVKLKAYDIKGSFKSVPVRAPWSYSKKRQTTNAALLVSDFVGNKISFSYFRKKPEQFISIEAYTDLLKFYVIPQYFVTIQSPVAKRFLNLIGYKTNNKE